MAEITPYFLRNHLSQPSDTSFYEAIPNDIKLKMGDFLCNMPCALIGLHKDYGYYLMASEEGPLIWSEKKVANPSPNVSEEQKATENRYSILKRDS